MQKEEKIRTLRQRLTERDQQLKTTELNGTQNGGSGHTGTNTIIIGAAGHMINSQTQSLASGSAGVSTALQMQAIDSGGTGLAPRNVESHIPRRKAERR